MPLSRASVMIVLRVMPLSSAALTGVRVQRAVEHQEEVFAGAFAEQAGRRERDAFAETEPARLARDQLARKIIATGFRARGNRVRRETLPARHAGVDALLRARRRRGRAHLPARDGDVDRRVGGKAESAKAAKRDGPQVGCAKPFAWITSRHAALSSSSEYGITMS